MTAAEHWHHVRQNHRGPYRFHAVRPPNTPRGRPSSEWFRWRVEADDVAEEANALLGDPRDTIIAIDVWSEKESQFVMTFRSAPGERKPWRTNGEA